MPFLCLEIAIPQSEVFESKDVLSYRYMRADVVERFTRNPN